MLKWAASEELVPASVYQSLATVAGLQAGRTDAAEYGPVEPADDAVVEATLPHLNRHVRGLVQFQRLTGCRPSEACALRRCDIDASGVVWLYRPATHKSAWRGKSRVIAVGPQAQALLRDFFTDNPADYLFSPRKAVGEFHAARAGGRKTPLYPSHAKRNAGVRVSAPKRAPAERYDVCAYGHAVARACERAFPAPAAYARLAKESRKEWLARLAPPDRAAAEAWYRKHRWAPNRLRHAHGTEVRKRFGLEAAQVSLGHAHAAVTEVYAEKNLALAAQVALAVG